MQRRLEAAGLPPEPEHVGELQGMPAPPRHEPRPEAAAAAAPQATAPAEDRASSHDDDMQPESIQIDPVSGKYICPS